MLPAAADLREAKNLDNFHLQLLFYLLLDIFLLIPKVSSTPAENVLLPEQMSLLTT